MADSPRTSELAWPGFSTAWAWVPPHGYETTTGARQVGVAFSSHRDVHIRSGSRSRRASYGGGSVVCSGADPITWSDVRDPTEALEIYPSPALVAAAGGTGSKVGWPIDRMVVGVADPVVLAIAGILRRAHVASAYVGETAGSALGHLLVRHVLVEYGGRRVPPVPGHARLTRAQVAAVADLVAEDLAGCLTLDRLAAETHLSAFHFARAFTATVGLAPHAYVTARRMDRARLLLATTGLSVAEVAGSVGFANLSHFRRVFRVHAGTGPAAYRDDVR